MKPDMKRGLTKVALALMLAGYCAVPAAMAKMPPGSPVERPLNSKGLYPGSIAKGGMPRLTRKMRITLK